MGKEEVIKRLLDKYPNSSLLRKERSEISDMLFGELSGGPCNVYELPGGIVVSKQLIQGREKDPTVGIITPGNYEFDTGGNTETMIVLEGCLQAYVKVGQVSTLQQYGSIIAPARTKLKLAASNDVFYLCQYKPRE